MTTTTWSPEVYHAGYRVAVAENAAYQGARITLADGSVIFVRWTRPAIRDQFDGRDLDLHTRPGSPRGSIRDQIKACLRSHGVNSVSFADLATPHGHMDATA